MKKLSLLILFLLAYCFSFSQFPVTQNLGAPKTLVVSKGGLQADSALILPVFPDTGAANLSPYVKNYSGNMIIVGNQVYVRNATATAWLILATSGTAVGSVQSVTQGYGITNSPNPITVSGTVKVDTTVATGLSGKYLRIVDTNKLVSKTQSILTTAPLTGGGNLTTTRTISMPAATASVNGYLTSTNFTTFNNKENALTFTSPLSRTTNTISIPQATSSVSGYLNATDWNTFNNKVSSTRTISTTSPLFGGGDLSTNLTFSIKKASATDSGYLSAANWNTFNNKIGPSDTANRWVNNITRTPGKDSIIFFIGANRYAIKDSTGGGGTITTAVDTIYRTIGKDSIQFTIGGRYRAIKDSVGIGTVTSVSGVSPIQVFNGATTPQIQMPAASNFQNGYLTSSDWVSFTSKVSSVGGSGLIVSTGGYNPVISSSVNANKLVGRNSITGGEMEEITIGSGLSMTGTTLFLSGGAGGSQNLQQVINTGDTLTNTFHFSTNAGDPKVNLDGVRLSAPRTYQFPDSSGILALKSDLAAPTYTIDLTAANYTMTNAGVYNIIYGTDSTTPYYITFPDAIALNGKRITLINNAVDFLNNAIIDTTSGHPETTPKYQGSQKTVWQIPYGMTYEFVSINGYWMSTNPMPVNTQDLWLDYDTYGEQYIPFGGIYKTYDAAPAKEGNYYRIWFPDPKKNNGERITLINSDTTYPIKIQGTWIPVSKNSYSNIINKVAPQSTYEFVSMDSQWVCVNMSTPPTFYNLDLSTNASRMKSNGVYQINNAYGNPLEFPVASEFDGKTITIINSDGTNDANIAAPYPISATSSSITIVGSGVVDTFTSIGGKWILTSSL